MIGEILSGILLAVLVANIIIDYRKIKKEDDNYNKLAKLEQEFKNLSIACLATAKTTEATALVLSDLGEKVNELRGRKKSTTMDKPLQK